MPAYSPTRERMSSVRRWWYGLLSRPRLDTAAEQRGVELLRQNLSRSQREQFDRYGYFDVKGGDSGVRYRLHRAHQLNVERLDARGRCIAGLCFMPKGQLPLGDMLLAQKLALELFETETLEVANVTSALCWSALSQSQRWGA